MIPPSTARADLEAALGRYRCLFDQQVEGWDAFINTLMRPLPTWIWAHPWRIEGQELRALIAEEGVNTEPVPWLAPWWSSVAARVAELGVDLTPDGAAFGSKGPLAAGNGSSLGSGAGSDTTGALGARTSSGASFGAAASPIPLRLPPGFKAGQRWWYCAGLAHAQEAVSQLPVMLLDVRPGQRVLDLCAAPGGKTAQLAFALGNRGTLLANDFAPERIAALQGNLDRLGVLNCSTTRCDGGNYPVAAGAFDRILVDAPCSSEGTLRRNPSLVQRGGHGSGERSRAHAGIGPERSQRMAGRQRALLRKAVQLCRPGGRIVYSTCTFAPEENELIVAEILDEQNGNLELLPAELPGLVAAAGVTHWLGRRLDPSLSHCLRVWPHANDTGGFFVAVLQKAAQGPGLDPASPARLQLEPDDDGWLQELVEHYGLPASALAGCRLHRQTRRGLHLMAADHLPPAAPSLQGSGLFAYRTNIRPPKLTTGAALLLGSAASRQTLELSAEQRDRYLRRELLHPSPKQMVDCRPGQVLVRHRGFTLGVAVLHRSGDLESLFPSRWSGRGGGA